MILSRLEALVVIKARRKCKSIVSWRLLLRFKPVLPMESSNEVRIRSFEPSSNKYVNGVSANCKIFVITAFGRVSAITIEQQAESCRGRGQPADGARIPPVPCLYPAV